MTPDTYPSLFAGYTVIWLLISAYVLHLGTRLRKLEKSKNDSNQKR